jgi:hypothetical protein
VPFTPSHAAAVLPFFRLSRRGVVPSALVIGSMSPDIPYYVPMPVERALSHSFTGVVTIDLALGLAVFVAWQGVVAAGVLAIAPAGLRRRLGPAQPAGLRHHLGSARGAGLVVVSLVVGAVTHVVWDTFTHSGTWGTEQFAVLREFYGPRPLYRWAQYASGLVGGAVLATAAAWWWRTTPPRHDDEPEAGHRLAFGAWLAVLLAGLVGGAVAALGPLTAAPGADWRGAAFMAATRGGAAAAVTLLLFAVGRAVLARSAGGAERRP